MFEQVNTSPQCTQTTSVTVRSVPERSVHCNERGTTQHLLLRFVSLLNQISDTMIYKPFHCVHTKTCAPLSAQPLRANVVEFSFCYSLGPSCNPSNLYFIWFDLFDYVCVLVKCPIYMKNYSFFCFFNLRNTILPKFFNKFLKKNLLWWEYEAVRVWSAWSQKWDVSPNCSPYIYLLIF